MTNLLVFLAFLLYFSNVTYAASTSRERNENEKLVGMELHHKQMGHIYNRFAYEAEEKKDRWKAKKERTNCFPWKGICKGMEKSFTKEQEANAEKSGEHFDKANEISQKLDIRYKDFRKHQYLLQQVEKENPRAKNRLARSNSLKQAQEQRKSDRRHKHTNSF
jgi:hypothetical protein